jgi:uncharacterized repeat protein (TIGR01451 family)
LEQEKKYDWSDAVKSYTKALGLMPEEDFLKIGEFYERLGYASYRAAMQAESQEEFKERMQQAVVNYEKAREFYGKMTKSVKTPKMLRCAAMIAYMGHWLEPEVPEKKRLLDECWKLTKQSLEAFEEAGDSLEYGKTFNLLSSSAVFIFTREWDFQARSRTMSEAVENGERAIKFLSNLGEPCELARACAKTVLCMTVYGYYCTDGDDRKRCYYKGLDYWQKANGLSEEIAMLELIYPVFGEQILLGLEGTDEALTNYKKALEYAKKTKDKFLIGCALDWLTYHHGWKARGTEDPDEAKKLLKTVLNYAEDAKQQFSKISFVSPRGDLVWIEAPYASYFMWMADLETDLKRRRELVEKAMKAAKDDLKRAEDSGYPEIVLYGHGTLTVALLFSAKMEMNLEEKKRLLEEALEQINEDGRICRQIEPFLYWNYGVGLSRRSTIKSELADLAKDSETKKTLLQEAALDKENAWKFCLKELAFFEEKTGPTPSLFAPLGSGQYEYGNLLNRLFRLTCDREHLRRAIKAFEDAAKSYQRLNLTSRMAECHWKTAQTYDDLGDHLKSAENFDLASNYYKGAAEKILQLKDFYLDHALYMQAWSEIEKARHHHRRQEYGSAEEHFEKAAQIHKSLKQWSYLAPNYAAWAQVEHAEELSRKDQSEEAIQAFEQSCKLFNETKKSLQEQLGRIENPDEKQMATHMLKATDLRLDYCTGRTALEEARILDKKGDHYSSSERYGSAAEIFEKINQASEAEQEKKEFQLIVCLSQAWQKMTRAEAEASPELYSVASQLFEDAKDCSPNEQTKMLALGHSRFCKALEAGTKFADTGDISMHAAAVQYLESAAKYYVKAGFQKVSEYAKATELLFDAYAQMNNAKKEIDPEKKARFYMMTEKVLQTSAGSFMKAEHPEKMEQVLRLLDKVREERELAVSLTEVLHAPSIVSTTTAFNTPIPTQEEAVGLEKFENADIQANIIPDKKELNIGETLDLEIELVNAGKGPALLIKVTELIPKGFELTEKPEKFRVEDSFINLKGKRLDPLRTEEVRLGLKSKVQGVFLLKPTILYLDENGKYKSHQPESVNITVKELGIKGWLKGEK